MIGKQLVKLLTRFALRSKKSKRGSNSYVESKSVGVLYTYSTEKNHNLIYELVKKLESDGKLVKMMTFIPKAKKTDSYDYPFFSEKDLKTSGQWEKKEVREFKSEPFDFLLSLDKELNKYSKNILATSKASCRVGQYEEGSSAYFEMMINNNEEDDFNGLLDQFLHYIKIIKNE